MVPYRGPSQGGLPRPTVPGVFGVPGTPAPYGAINRFPASVAPSTSGSAPPKPEVERLPPIDLNQPPVKPLPKPIPLYPETGY